jgi:hypothetical protein
MEELRNSAEPYIEWLRNNIVRSAITATVVITAVAFRLTGGFGGDAAPSQSLEDSQAAIVPTAVVVPLLTEPFDVRNDRFMRNDEDVVKVYYKNDSLVFEQIALHNTTYYMMPISGTLPDPFHYSIDVQHVRGEGGNAEIFFGGASASSGKISLSLHWNDDEETATWQVSLLRTGVEDREALATGEIALNPDEATTLSIHLSTDQVTFGVGDEIVHAMPSVAGIPQTSVGFGVVKASGSVDHHFVLAFDNLQVATIEQ